jgi:hypothetical protein
MYDDDGIRDRHVAFLAVNGPADPSAWSGIPVSMLSGLQAAQDSTGLAQRTAAYGKALERQTLQRCAAAVFSSSWAIRSAVDHSGLLPDRVHEIPSGADLDQRFDAAVAERQAYLEAALPAHSECVRRLNWRSPCEKRAEAPRRVLSEPTC